MNWLTGNFVWKGLLRVYIGFCARAWVVWKFFSRWNLPLLTLPYTGSEMSGCLCGGWAFQGHRLTLHDIRYFWWTWHGPGKNIYGTFMSSNHLLTHQAYKNGQHYALKQSKNLSNCKRDSRRTQIFKFF